MADTPKKPASKKSSSNPKPDSKTPSTNPAATGSLSANLRSRIPVGNNADLSKGQKAKGIVKGAADGAAGKNAAGLAAGGQLTGALAGAGQALLSQTKLRTIVITGGLATMAPFLILITVLVTISSLFANTVSQQVAGAAQAVTSSTGVTSSNLGTVQNASIYTPTPWTVLEAAIYYETGAGASVARFQGACPVGSPTGSLCPSTLAALPGSLTLGSSPQGSAPPTSAQSGFNPSVGRNGTVPTTLSPSSPDWTSTNTANWDCIRQAESDDNYTSTSGAYGILPSTWASIGQLGTPGQASRSLQDAAALEILNYEGHFYGAWNDLCTHPTAGPNGKISFIAPGVANPTLNGSAPATSRASSPSGSTAGTTPSSPAPVPTYGGGTCPYRKNHPHYYGPYCLKAGTMSVAGLSDLGQSSTWMAKTIGTSLTRSGVGDQLDLTAGISVSATAPPVLDPASNVAQSARKGIISALAALPMENNSTVMDVNIYGLAVAWTNGYSPISASTCSPTGPAAPAPTSIPGPANSGAQSEDLLSITQVTLADQIVTDATSDGASQTTQIAAVTAALALSNLSASPSGIFANGATSVASAVTAFVSANKRSTQAADAQAANALGGSPSVFTGWLAGATQLVSATSGVVQACGSTVPTVPGGSPAAQRAVQAAEAEIGLPYVWGGGGTNGPSGSASAPPSQVGQPGFDCSGLVEYAFARAGVTLPRVAQDQFDYVQAHSTLTTVVAQLQPGDLVFFSDNEQGVNHVAIYLGDGNIIQAPQTGSDVSYATLAGDMGLGFLGGGPAA
jgi:cell wall-associated NlpC family hydrolase